MNFPKRGLYAITQTEHKTDAQIIADVEQVLSGGAVVLQYRDKRTDKTPKLAEQLLTICRQYHVPLIINDDVELARQLNADGVHLGKDDSTIIEARLRLGQHAIIGVSCYNNLEAALHAEQQGANYVAFGRFFSSSTKPLASPA
ncbi:partial thiamine-phosphate pyrophosphorylase, partial [Candidatus Brocadiaceae bacterium]